MRHTCISAPPTLTLSGKPGTDLITDTLASDGIWERTVERTWTVEEDDDDVNCTVQYPGGQRATKQLILNAECEYSVRQYATRTESNIFLFGFNSHYHISA